MKFNAVDLFGAPGGLALGFKMTRKFRIIACVDMDKRAAATYKRKRNIPEANVVVENIQNVNADMILEDTDTGKNEIDIVMGGPPCQAFSNIGRVKLASLERKRGNHSNGYARFIDDPRNELYKHFVRIVSELKPKFIVMENVRGILSHRDGKTVKEVIQDFKRLGYDIGEPQLIDAAWFGVPQHRKRVIFIANRIGAENPILKPVRLPEPVTVWEAIGDLPSLKAGGGKDPMKYRKRQHLTRYQQKIRSGSKDVVHNHIARPHGSRDIKLFKSMKEGMKWKDVPARLRRMYGYRDDVFNDKMKRLFKNKPSWTVVAHLAKDGYMFIHPTQNRTITVREAARLQSFPDRFIFEGSRSDQFRQVGNAVPPLMGAAIAKKIAKVMI